MHFMMVQSRLRRTVEDYHRKVAKYYRTSAFYDGKEVHSHRTKEDYHRTEVKFHLIDAFYDGKEVDYHRTDGLYGGTE